MKLVWSETDAGRTSLAICPSSLGEVASFPRELLLDTRLDARPPDRLWVAAALCFGHRLAGTWDATTPVSAEIRAAIGEYLGPQVAFNPTISDASFQWHPGGGSAMVLAHSDRAIPSALETDDAAFVIELRELGDWAGRLYSIDRLITASNAFVHANLPGSGNPVGPFIAAALLLATDLHMDQLIFDRSGQNDVDPEWWARAQRLCAAVGIDLNSSPTTPVVES